VLLHNEFSEEEVMKCELFCGGRHMMLKISGEMFLLIFVFIVYIIISYCLFLVIIILPLSLLL
jgi:hypothetical protein